MYIYIYLQYSFLFLVPGRAAGDAFPEVGFLSRELRLHAPLHGEFRLTHVGTVALQLLGAEDNELGEVVPWGGHTGHQVKHETT